MLFLVTVLTQIIEICNMKKKIAIKVYFKHYKEILLFFRPLLPSHICSIRQNFKNHTKEF